MLWFFRYWERRYRRDLDAARRALVDDDLALPETARIVTADGLERSAPTAELVAGQRVRIAAGEVVPLDAVVCSGAALVDETAFGGALSPSRKIVGHKIAAGSKLLAGALELEVVRTVEQTRAPAIAQALSAVATPAAGDWALNRDAENFADVAVAPTLLTAGAGLALADLATVGAVLRPDYATGIGLAAPLVGLRNLRFALQHGGVVRTPDALDRLAQTPWIAVADHPALREPGFDLVEIRTSRLDRTKMLPAAAAAGAWLGDERGPALGRACREQGLVVRRAELRAIDGDGVPVQFGRHLVRVHGRPVVVGVTPPPLFVDVDGVEVGAVRFGRNGRPAAAATVSQLRRQGLRVLLLSPGSAKGLAHALDVDRYAGHLSSAEQLSLLREFGRQNALAYVCEEAGGTSLAREAHVSIGLAGTGAPEAGWEASLADVFLLAPSIVALPALVALARDHVQRKQRARYAVIGPNLVCVAGAFVFGFTPIAAVLLSNFGTGLAYHGARRALDVKLPVQFAEPGSVEPPSDPEPIKIRTAA